MTRTHQIMETLDVFRWCILECSDVVWSIFFQGRILFFPSKQAVLVVHSVLVASMYFSLGILSFVAWGFGALGVISILTACFLVYCNSLFCARPRVEPPLNLSGTLVYRIDWPTEFDVFEIESGEYHSFVIFSHQPCTFARFTQEGKLIRIEVVDSVTGQNIRSKRIELVG